MNDYLLLMSTVVMLIAVTVLIISSIRILRTTRRTAEEIEKARQSTQRTAKSWSETPETFRHSANKGVIVANSPELKPEVLADYDKMVAESWAGLRKACPHPEYEHTRGKPGGLPEDQEAGGLTDGEPHDLGKGRAHRHEGDGRA